MQRRNPIDATELSEPDRKRWGRFSGSRHTAIILGIVIAIAFPVGALAVVATSNAINTGAERGTHTSVGAKGQRAVAPLIAPGSMFSIAGFGTLNESGTAIHPGSATNTLVLTSISVGVNGFIPVSANFDLTSAGATCAATPKQIGIGTISPSQTEVSMTFPTGIAIEPNRRICLAAHMYAYPHNSLDLNWTVTGYYATAAECQTPHACK
jgi:hypothetical protein